MSPAHFAHTLASVAASIEVRVIYRVDVAEIRLQRGDGPIEEIDVADYAASSSEPVM